MESEREKLILDGNAFYEIDLDCQKEKEQKRQRLLGKMFGDRARINVNQALSDIDRKSASDQ